MHLLTRPWDRIQFARSVTLNVWRALAVLCATGLTPLSAAEALSFSGITEPILDAVMSSPVPGIVGTRAHQEGDFVEQGRLIMELDKKLEELEVSRRQALVVPLKADLEAHRALVAKGTISVSVEMLEKKEAEYNVAFAEFELAKEQLRKRQIVAPFAGFIAELYREVGESCQANERLVRIVDTRRCYFVCNIEAKTGHRLKLGQQLPLEIEAGETPVKITGAIHFISPVVDPASGLLKIKLIFENTDGKIRPGVAGRLVLEDRAAGD